MKAHVAFLGRGVQLHPDTDQPERDAALPDRAHVFRMDECSPCSPLQQTCCPEERAGRTSSNGTVCGRCWTSTAAACGSTAVVATRSLRLIPNSPRAPRW